MKKTICISILILMFVTTSMYAGTAGKKNVKYCEIAAFMTDYFNAYNLYSQDASTIDLMDRYYAPEFLSIQYLPLPQPLVMDRTTWKYFLVGIHSQFIETLTLEEMSIDTKQLTAVARLTVEMTDRVTGIIILRIHGMGFYNLKLNQTKDLQMTCLKLYFSDPASLMAISGPPEGM